MATYWWSSVRGPPLTNCRELVHHQIPRKPHIVMLLGLFTPAIQLVNWRVSGCSVKRHQLQAMFTGIQRSRAQWRCLLLQYCYDFNRTSSLLMRSPPQHGSGKSPHRCQMWWACLCRQGAHQPRPTGQNFPQTLAIYGPVSFCARYTSKHFTRYENLCK